jgi:hypothetical protein
MRDLEKQRRTSDSLTLHEPSKAADTTEYFNSSKWSRMMEPLPVYEKEQFEERLDTLVSPRLEKSKRGKEKLIWRGICFTCTNGSTEKGYRNWICSRKDKSGCTGTAKTYEHIGGNGGAVIDKCLEATIPHNEDCISRSNFQLQRAMECVWNDYLNNCGNVSEGIDFVQKIVREKLGFTIEIPGRQFEGLMKALEFEMRR